jgi:hypothetical protein
MRWVLAFVLWVGLVLSAHAQIQNSGFVGYQFPEAGRCSPVCTGVLAQLKIPSFSGASTLFAWIGAETHTGDGTVCTAACLGQFGIKVTSGALSAWWELACTSGGTGCGSVTPITGFTVSTGDVINLQMTCTANCTGISTETWAVTLTDETTAAVCNMHSATTCGSSGVTFTWPLSLNNGLNAVYEVDGIVTWAQPGSWSNLQYQTGLPGSQITHNWPLTPNNNLWTVGSGAGASKSVSASGPVGPNGNDFNICPPVTSATYNACGASWYGPTPALGP